jgi:Arc/MetJ-type ribon-helix-helix transcriptional regulator
MPSTRRQINVRLSEESEARLKGLVERMRAALGIQVSQSDVIQAGLVELEKRYPPDQAAAKAAPQPPPAEATKAKARGRKPKGE